MSTNPNESGDRTSQESPPIVAVAEAITMYKPPKPEDKSQLISSGEAARRVRGKGTSADTNKEDKK